MLNRPSVVNRAFAYKRCVLGGSSFVAALFGKPDNRSLSQLTSPDEEVRRNFGNYLEWIHDDLGIRKAYAPSPIKFTDRIADPSELTVQVPIGKRMLYRNPEKPADGVPIKAGEACFVSPSSCPTTVMVGSDGRMLVLHTGRDCLIDRHGLEHGTPMPGRKHPSIVYSALYYLGKPEEVRVKVFWGVPPHLFIHDLEHPVYGKTNEKMRHVIATLWGPDSVPIRNNKFQLDLPKLVRDQCISRGVPEANIDLTDAYQFASGTWLDGAPGTPRNLVVVSRHS